jgi:iron complex outermembrane receptor protein
MSSKLAASEINRANSDRFSPSKTALFATVGASALLVASAAYAQEATGPIESVTVSSSRITTAGFNAPTPTTVLGNDFIEKQAKDNIFSTVVQLPSLLGSTGQQSNVNGTSGGTNGLLSFNMFGLGTTRTLTLLDGQRFAPANVTGVTDISEFPQLLIQRVDVVTGGASASWGSDAIAGVVNFVTDKKFVGFKANISTGLSTYADNATMTAQLAVGTSFAGGRGHVEFATEFSHSDGVQGGWQQLTCCGGRSTNSLSGGRTWFIEPTTLQYSSPAATPAGQPQFFNTANGQQNQLGRYGIINSGPLQGIAFGPNGAPYAFNYGTGTAGVNTATGFGGTQQGVPAHNGSAGTPGTVNNCIVQFCIGGELDNQTGSGVTLEFPLTRGNVYTRASYDLTPNTEVFMTLNWSEVGSSNIPNPDMWLGALPGISGGTGQSNAIQNIGNSSIFSTSSFNPGQLLQAPGVQCGNAAGGANAFLPASIQAACIANNITSFSFGSLYYGLGPQVVYTQRDNRRYVGGADGTFNMFDTDWTWQTYYEHGENDTNIHVRGIALKPYMYAAIDTVQVGAANVNNAPYAALGIPSGTIVCRSTTAIQEGCVPFNPFGAPVTQAQKDWIYGGRNWGPGPMQLSHQMQDMFDFSFSGTPLSDWAGKISVAFGGSWRQEAYDVRGDGAGNGTLAGAGGAPGSPCNDPVLNCLNGTNWYAGSFHNAQGNYHVIEGFVEVNVPLIDSPEWGTANLNVAGRHARYSTAGDSNTWKAGVTWETPLDGLRLRALQSRDVRAPNLAELFAAPVTANGSATDPWINQNIQVINGTYGNPALKPEKSINTQLGIVLQPSWLPGFQASVDYYRIAVAGQINTVSTQTNINQCFATWQTTHDFSSPYCSAIVVAAGTNPASNPQQWLQVNTQFFNVASTVTDGFNIESSYQFSLDDWSVMPIPGNFTVRALATYVTKFITNPGTPGAIIVNSAGANDGNIPHMKVFAQQSYDADNWEFHVAERWISEGKHNNNYIQCVPGSCPVPTLQNPTINDNHVPGIFYFDLGGSWNVSEHWKIYGQVDNLLNKNPPINYSNSQNPTNDGMNPTLYDAVGRMFHVGVRISD